MNATNRDQLKVGDIYTLRSRNLEVGAYTGETVGYRNDLSFPEFIGIREKFGYRYLSKEAGWEPFTKIGTVPSHATLDIQDKVLRRSLAQHEARARRST